MEHEGNGPVVVGVHPDQSTTVIAEAARLAEALSRPLVCAYVTEDSYLTEWDQPEVRTDASLHPQGVGRDDERLGLDLAARLTVALGDDSPVDWRLRILAGDPAKALARLAEEVDARTVVVGTHGSGFSRAVEDWLAGSVAAHLTRDQRRPVVVVPVPRGKRHDADRLR